MHRNPAEPLYSQYGPVDPGEAVKRLAVAAQTGGKFYGLLDVAWGEVNRFASGKADLPGNGVDGSVGVARIHLVARKGTSVMRRAGKRLCAPLNLCGSRGRIVC